MSDNCITLIIHHRGIFHRHKYEGGVEFVDEELDVDKLSYPEIMSYVKDLGYQVIGGLYVKGNVRDDLVLVHNDSSLLQVASSLKEGDCLELYVDHNCHRPGIPENDA